ncbi:MAG: RidA family protein [Pseudomonadota bacterium]
MERTSINPAKWGANFALDQAVLTTGESRVLRISGQVSMVDDASAEMGFKIMHEGDMAGQMRQALANADAVLKAADMSRSDIVFVRLNTTDMEAFMANYGVYAEWISAGGITPANTVIGVQCLALPELLIEIEITAAA